MRDTCLNKVEGDTQDPKSCPDLHMHVCICELSLAHTYTLTYSYIHSYTQNINTFFYKEWIVRPWAPPQGGRGLSFLLLFILHIFVEIMIQFISLFSYINLQVRKLKCSEAKKLTQANKEVSK